MKNCDGSECNYQKCIDEAIAFIANERVTVIEFIVIKLLCIIASILIEGGNKNANSSKTK